MTGAAYRVSQFMRALLAEPAADDARLVAEHLPTALRPVYNRMSRADQAHAVAVLRALLRQGYADPDLLAAGLLHDAGKVRVPLRLIDRVVVVLAQRLAPARVRAWSSGAPGGWRRPFIVAARHAEWGAEILERAGASARLVELVRRHHACAAPAGGEADRWLAALQDADGSH